MLRAGLFAFAFLSFVLGGLLIYITPQVIEMHHLNANMSALWNLCGFGLLAGGFTLMIVAICDGIDEARNIR